MENIVEGRKAFQAAVHTERYRYFETSSDVLQWLLKQTKWQMRVMPRNRYREARITHEAIKQELHFRNRILNIELKLAEKWDVS
jgi:hypothetical protein